MANTPPLRVEIKPHIRVKIDKVAMELNRSSGDLVNTILENVEEIEIRQLVVMKIRQEKADDGDKPQRVKTIRRASNWVTRF